jgi:TetR/AcrR family transcriptional repressor of nem operon
MSTAQTTAAVTSDARTTGNDTRSKLLRQAAAMSQTVGYDALSLQDLANELGIRKASIFHHFASKDELARAVVESDIKMFDHWSHSVESLPPEQRLTKYFDYYRDMIQNGHVCPGGAFAISWPMLPEKVRSKLVEMHRQHAVFLDELVKDGLAAGVFTPRAIASDIVKSIPDMLQGAIQVGRAGSSVIPINRIERITKVLLGLSAP